jgi:ankyrin repeat protein
MRRTLTPQSTLEQLRKDAKRWLRSIQDGDPAARARLTQSHPDAPADPGLRDVQLALAREYGFPGWTALKQELQRRHSTAPVAPRDAAIQALIAAAARGDAPSVRELLDSHPDIVNERGPFPGTTGRRTALHFAMNTMSEAVVDLLLAHGADPNLRDDGDNAMPLHFAVEKGHLPIVRKLIEHGADPIGGGDLHQLEVIGWATCFAREPQPDLIAYLLSHGATHNIFSAVATGTIDAIRSIGSISRAELDRPMDGTNHRRRPLHLAVLKRQPQALEALLALGADTEAEDAAGLTPLDQAALAGESEMAKQLLTAGAHLRLPAAVALDRPADVERLLRSDRDALRRGGRWQRLILRAAERSSGQVIEALIRAGASVHARDDHRTAVDGTHGYTPLHAAAYNGNLDAARVLLRYGADAAAREDKYWGTPAGWANYAGHAAARDIILEAGIDIFDVILFDRSTQLAGLLARDPEALERRFGEYVTGDKKPRPWVDPAWTPLLFAVGNNKRDMVALLLSNGADRSAQDSAGHTALALAEEKHETEIVELLRQAGPQAQVGESYDQLVARFLRMSCLDWRHGGSERGRAKADAGRLLARTPALAHANIYTAVTCGELETVRRLLDARPEVTAEPGGPRSWSPLLYLCSARLPSPQSWDNAVPVARLLLERGADPNAFFLGGNADIHYTPLTCVLGRGEDQAETHPRAPELAELLMEHGAEPCDNQVLYNVFANHASRRLLTDDIVWLLELMHRYSLRRGQGAAWQDPTWPLFDMRGAPSLGDEAMLQHGAYFMLSAAIDRNLLRLAEWMLSHGAGPNTPAGRHRWPTGGSPWQEAGLRGYTEMQRLLERYGAIPAPLPLDDHHAFVAACLKPDPESARDLLVRHLGYREDHRALFAAVERNRPEAVELLLDLGVSPDVADREHGGRRALHVAAYVGAAECAEVLIRRGATVDVRETTYNAIPLGVASWAQQPNMIALLGRHSRDVWELTYAGQIDRLREVLREEPGLARVSTLDAGTPLMWLPLEADAAFEAVALLLDHGADPTVRDGKRRTAADIAEARGLDQVVELLRSRGG